MRFIDLTGQTFGRLTVLKRVENTPGYPSCKSGYPQYECVCSCPDKTVLIVRGCDLRNGHIQSCGCLRRELSSTRMKNNELAHRRSKEAIYHDLTGKVFGRLTVIRRSENSPKGKVRYLCRCIEGNECVVAASNLISGRTQSCGCLMRERARDANLIWAPEESDLVAVLNSMHSRCYNPNNDAYARYGGRGITICNEWLDHTSGKRAFVEWARSHGYRKGLSIDRIDNNGPYAPWNCRFTDDFGQANNTRKNVNIQIGDDTHTVAEWARLAGIDPKRLYPLWNSDRCTECISLIRAGIQSMTTGGGNE